MTWSYRLAVPRHPGERGKAGSWWRTGMRSQAGFTLLELLIAMTLMSMVLVLLYGGLRIATQGWDVGEQRAERLNEISLVQDFIRRQLHQSLTLFSDDKKRGEVVVFTGEPERISVIAPLLAYLGLGGLYVLDLSFSREGEAGQLRMRWYPYRPTQPEKGDEGSETVLLENVDALQWAYFGAEQDDKIPSWHERWQSTRQRPTLVRLSLRLAGEGWPDLVATLAN